MTLCAVVFVHLYFTSLEDRYLDIQMKKLFVKYLKRVGLRPNRIIVHTTGTVILDVGGSGLEDLSLLHGMNLYELNVSSTKVTDLDPITAFTQLAELKIARTRINNLESLRNLPIVSLDIRQTDVKDISVLTNMPSLKHLALLHTAVTNLDVVLGMNLYSLEFSPELVPREQVEKLRTKEFGSINYWDPKEFWRQYDKSLEEAR